MSLLDEENVKIIRAMKKHGPRNLQEISRKTEVPYPTVYTRVNKLVGQGLLKTWVQPNFSKIGLVRAQVILTTIPGRELLAHQALKIPGYWLRIARCTGEWNGYYSMHAIPLGSRQDFVEYLDHVVSSGLARSYKISWLGEQTSNIPNFEFYDMKKRAWNFAWEQWLREFTAEKRAEKLESSASAETRFDKSDLVILKELMKDARTKLSEFAKLIGVTLPAAKYRFDNLVQRGFVHDYIIETLPYPPEISQLYEVRLDFPDEKTLASKAKILRSLPFVVNYSSIRGSNSLSVRVYLVRGQINNLLILLSALVRRKVLERFLYLYLDSLTVEAQTFPLELFKNGTGWHYDNQEYLRALRSLTSSLEKGEPRTVTFQPIAITAQMLS
jgi:DNA-binding Lrp family transcriptional regulator